MGNHAFSTAFEAFEATAAAFPEQAFLCIPPRAGRAYAPAGVEFSYGEALAQIVALRELYRRSGFGIGHRVALLLDNRPGHFFHLFALNALGASAVAINTGGTVDEMLYQLEHSEAEIAIGTMTRADDYAALVAKRSVPLPLYPEIALPAVLAAPRQPPREGQPGRATEATLLYTSGTTGRQKGCVITNEYFLTAGEWYLSRGGALAIEHGGERLYNPFPVFHMNAGVLGLMAMVLSANCVISADRFHPTSWWQDLATTRATAMHYMGVIPAMLLKQPAAEDDRSHRVKYALGAGVDPELHILFEERFGLPLVEVWGMTETGRILSDHQEPRRIDTRSVGRVRPGLDVMLAGDDDRPVAAGQPGHLLVRAPGPDPRRGFFSGYLKDEAATAEAWRGGWFHTGDVFREDTDGSLLFVDRQKNIIRRSGENIAAAEVEAVLITHPAVLSVAVVPVRDELREEEVLACVVLRPEASAGSQLADELFRHCHGQLSYHKTPGWLLFRSSLPVTSTSKIQKSRIFGADEDPREFADIIDLRDRKRRSA